MLRVLALRVDSVVYIMHASHCPAADGAHGSLHNEESAYTAAAYAEIGGTVAACGTVGCWIAPHGARGSSLQRFHDAATHDCPRFCAVGCTYRNCSHLCTGGSEGKPRFSRSHPTRFHNRSVYYAQNDASRAFRSAYTIRRNLFIFPPKQGMHLRTE